MASTTLRRQVLSQLASYPLSNPPTVAGLCQGMGSGADRKEVTETLRILKAEGLATADRHSRWRLTAAGHDHWALHAGDLS